MGSVFREQWGYSFPEFIANLPLVTYHTLPSEITVTHYTLIPFGIGSKANRAFLVPSYRDGFDLTDRAAVDGVYDLYLFDHKGKESKITLHLQTDFPYNPNSIVGVRTRHHIQMINEALFQNVAGKKMIVKDDSVSVAARPILNGKRVLSNVEFKERFNSSIDNSLLNDQDDVTPMATAMAMFADNPAMSPVSQSLIDNFVSLSHMGYGNTQNIQLLNG